MPTPPVTCQVLVRRLRPHGRGDNIPELRLGHEPRAERPDANILAVDLIGFGQRWQVVVQPRILSVPEGRNDEMVSGPGCGNVQKALGLSFVIDGFPRPCLVESPSQKLETLTT